MHPTDATEPGGADPPLLRVERLSAGFESRVIYRRVSFDVPASGVVAILGPAGVGKSTLLRTLARWNEPLPSFWAHGSVWYRGVDLLRDLDVEEARRRVALLAQKARLFTASILENAIAVVARDRVLTRLEKTDLAEKVLRPLDLWAAFRDRLDQKVTTLSIAEHRMLSIARLIGGGAECLLADEPLRDVATEDRDALLQFLVGLKQTHPLVITTHDQSIARILSDEVCLMTAGELVEVTPTERFFRSPRTGLGEQYLRMGNCWPDTGQVETAAVPREPSAPPRPPSWAPTAEETTPRPGGFHWVLRDLLGGMQWPGLLSKEEVDLDGLQALGVRHLVNLTEERFDVSHLTQRRIVGHHFPIPDMGVPSLSDAAALCERISRWIDAEETTVVHCRAGLGRTGTVLACALVTRGYDPIRAIYEVRQVNPMYIQSQVQLDFVAEMGAHLRQSATADGNRQSER